MKSLILIRHAKSSWDYDDLSDFERPLNDRGKRDALIMATALSAHLQSHCHWITSPAVRARTTAHRMARQLQFDTQKIEEDEALYHASVGTLQAVVERQPESIEQLVLFGHNPGLTSLCNAISSVRLDNLPTCGIFAVTWPGKQWAPLPMGQATFDFFDIPKHYK